MPHTFPDTFPNPFNVTGNVTVNDLSDGCSREHLERLEEKVLGIRPAPSKRASEA